MGKGKGDRQAIRGQGTWDREHGQREQETGDIGWWMQDEVVAKTKRGSIEVLVEVGVGTHICDSTENKGGREERKGGQRESLRLGQRKSERASAGYRATAGERHRASNTGLAPHHECKTSGLASSMVSRSSLMSGSLKKSALSESKKVSTEIVRSRSTCEKGYPQKTCR